jgi:Ca2+-binding RTX toxin-like protein
MIGGDGNDIYFVDIIGDLVYETTTTASSIDAGGTDTINTSITFSLDTAAGVRFVENLTLTGSAAINATGNGLNNTIIGNSGGNILNGRSGNDTLTGGGGMDFFIFNTAPNSITNVDTITDFLLGTDKLQFSKSIFVGLGNTVGNLTNAQFAYSTDQLTSTDRIIYNKASGVLSYDSDGLGNAQAVQVALIGVDVHPDLSFSDIMIIA